MRTANDINGLPAFTERDSGAVVREASCSQPGLTGDSVDPSAIERAIRITVASLEMEGFTVDPAHVALCRKMLAGEITMEECLAAVTPELGQRKT